MKKQCNFIIIRQTITEVLKGDIKPYYEYQYVWISYVTNVLENLTCNANSKLQIYNFQVNLQIYE